MDLAAASALVACQLGQDEGCSLFAGIADRYAVDTSDEALAEFLRLYCLSDQWEQCSSPSKIFPENFELAHRFSVIGCQWEIEGVYYSDWGPILVGFTYRNMDWMLEDTDTVGGFDDNLFLDRSGVVGGRSPSGTADRPSAGRGGRAWCPSG